MKLETLAPYGIMPVADELTRAYWEAAKEGRLAIQRCQSCQHYNHPPVLLCQNCADPSAELIVEPVSGKGTLRQWYMCHDTSVEGWEERVPYPVIAVELDEQEHLLLMSNLLNHEFGELGEGIHTGMRLEVIFDKADDDYYIPQFQPAQGE